MYFEDVNLKKKKKDHCAREEACWRMKCNTYSFFKL